MTTILLDSHIYDCLEEDVDARQQLTSLVTSGMVTVVVTPKVVDELKDSPFGGVPEWFPVTIEPEAVFVLGHARLGMARLSQGDVYKEHRGESNNIKDAIIAHSADALADVAVSNDKRFRHRLGNIASDAA